MACPAEKSPEAAVAGGGTKVELASSLLFPGSAAVAGEAKGGPEREEITAGLLSPQAAIRGSKTRTATAISSPEVL